MNLTLNGTAVTYDGDPERTLLEWLREDREVLSPKDGCSSQAYCYACTVEIDGKAKLACVTPMKKLDGSTVTTLEGFPERVRRVLGEAFVRQGAVQCGFCTPGFIAAVKVLLEKNPDPRRDEIVKSLKHHWCRCTGYQAITEAVLEAAAILRNAQDDPGLANGTVGGKQPKYEAYDKALGQGPFMDDIRLAGMLHGAVRLSDHPRAKLLNLDTTKAATLPGVEQIFTAGDVPGDRHTGLIVHDWPLMVAPGETTRYVGDVLAVVVAETEAQARAAAAALEPLYEVLEPLTDPELALASDILVHDNGNLLEESRIDRGGDADAILAASAHTASGTFHTQRIEHAFLEVECCVALPEDGTLRVHSQGQGVYEDRKSIASLLDLPVDQVRVKQWSAGGAFGGKEDLSVQGHAALAAHLLQKPVKVKLDRTESLRMHPKRHPIRMEYTVGCDEQGMLTAVKARVLGDTGAYASVGGKVLERAAGHATAAYHVPCADILAQAVYTNNLPCGAMRGFGANQATFAFECCLDELCRLGGFDRWQFRWDNALTAGSMTATGQVLLEGVGARATLEAVKDEFASATHAGIACGIKNCGIGNGMADWCEVMIEIVDTDHVVVHHGWTEMGQGVHTVAQQVVAQETGIDPAIIDVVTDTASDAESGMTTASRGTSLVGNALIVACKDLKRDIVDKSWAELAGKRYRGRWSFDRSTAPGAPGEVVTHYSYSYATQLVILDDEGRVEKVVAAHDAGHIMNPPLFEGQIVGSVHMGLGYALSEDMPMEGGRLVSEKLRDLGMIPMDGMPQVVVKGIEVTDPLGPYGAKGVGEVGLVPTAGAVANAFTQYDGERRYRLPLTQPVPKKDRS
ncbi:MAG: selenium-dependent xanthine dehydrogenase [bacterium]|nr:selenium-dependent xanthine dehydrogenase [bacterium]